MRNKTIHLLGLVLLMVISITSFAQEHDLHGANNHESHAHHNHHIAMFIGNTSLETFDSNAFTIGLDYMYFFPKSEHWGISAFAEFIMAHHTEFLFGFPVVYKFNNGFWARSGFGFELAKDEENRIEHYALLRIGGGYDFDFKKVILSPSIDFDGLRKHPAMVIGLNIGFGF